MLGFLIGKEVNDDAIRLNLICDYIKYRLMPLSRDEMWNKIERDFDDAHRHTGKDGITIVFKEMPLFTIHFYFDKQHSHLFQIVGRARYAGFVLHWRNDFKDCSAADGIGQAATGGARKLAQIMQKKFGFRDISRFM